MRVEIDTLAPDFSLLNSEREMVTLSEFRQKNQVVLLFFPLAFSSVCTNELCSIRDNLKMYREFQATVLGISVDSFYSLNAFKKAQNINFALLSDFNREVSSLYGTLYEDFNGMKGVSKRASFVIDKNGYVRHREVLEDSGKLPDFQAIQKALIS
ncbi:MAG: redoxin domain-containing protein [Balneolaceae bacterium]